MIGGEFEIPLEWYKDGTEDIGLEKDAGRYYYTAGRTCLYAILSSIAYRKGDMGGYWFQTIFVHLLQKP